MSPKLKAVLHIFRYLFFSLVLIFLLLVAAVNLPFVHTFITKKANTILSEKGYPIKIGKVTLLLNGKIGVSHLEIIQSGSDTIVYAGNASIDIYPFPLFSKKFIVKSIRLSDVVTNILTDSVTGEINVISVFNQAGGKQSEPEKATVNPENNKPWEVQIESIILKKIKVLYSDPAAGILVRQKLERAEIDFDNFSVLKKEIDAGVVKIDQPVGMVSVWETTVKAEDETEAPSAWKFSLQNLEVNDLIFTFEQPDAKQKIDVLLKSGDFSLEKLDLATHKIIVGKIVLNKPVISFTSENSNETNSTKETSSEEFSIPVLPWTIAAGEIKLIDGNFNYSDSSKTGENTLQKWFPVHDLNASFSNIRLAPGGYSLKLEKLKLALANTLKIQSGSIGFYLDSLENMGFNIELSALLNSNKKSWFTKDSLINLTVDLSGTTSAINIRKTEITSSSGLNIELNGTIQQPMKLPNSSCNLFFNSGIISRNQLVPILNHFSPSVKLPHFQPFLVKGSIQNSFLNPLFKLNLISKSGKLAANGNFNVQKTSGEIEASFSEVLLSELAGEIYPEKLTGNINAKGGLNKSKFPEGEMFIKIDSVVYKNKNTQNLTLKALAKNNKVDFNLNASDTSAYLDLSGFYEMKNKNSFSTGLNGTFDVDLFRMNLFSEPLSGKGKIDASFDYSGENITASAKMTDLEMGYKNDTISLEKTEFDLNATDSLIESQFKTRFLTAHFESNASFNDFKTAFISTKPETIFNLDSTNFLNLNAISNLEHFNLDATIKHDSIFNLFYPDSVMNFSDINISLIKPDINEKTELKISTDWISHRVLKSYAPQIQARIENDRLSFKIKTDSIVAREVKFGESGIDIEVLPSSIFCELNVNGRNDSVLHRIGFIAERDNNKVNLKSSGKSWLINHVPWNLSPPLFLTYDPEGKTVSANLDLHSSDKRILLAGNSTDKIKLDIQNIELKNLAIPGLVDFVPDGKINASAIYSQNKTDRIDLNMEMLQLKWGNIYFDRLAANGYLVADSTGINDSKLLIAADDSLSLMVEMETNSKKNEFYVDSKFKNLHFQLFEPFIREYANHLHGTSNGEIVFKQTGKNTDLHGELGFNDFGMKVLPLKSWLTIPDNEIKIENNQFIFNNFTVIDSLKRPLTVNGKIGFENMENIWTDLKVKADKIQVLNTTENDNPGFFGSVIINSGLNISGSIFSPEIKGNIDLESGTNVTYQMIQDLSVEKSQTDVVFATITDSLHVIYPETEKGKKTTKMPMIETVIRIDPNSIFNVKIADLYGIDISIMGNGLLSYTLLPNNTMSLNGMYEVKSGNCKLKITGWPLKDFLISPGSTFRWNGSIENPELRLEATSKVKGSYMNPIDNKSRPVDFIVSMQMKNQLSELEIVFGIQSADQYITSVLSSLSNDEIMRQAVNLLLFETIDLPGIESSGNYLASQMNSFWESQLNALTRTSLNKTELSFGIDTYNQATASGGQQEKTSFTYEMERKFMNDRATVKISGKLNDYNDNSYQTSSIFENFIFEYALDKNDSKYLKLYQKKDYEDMLEGEVIKYGTGFLYRKNYKKMKDIWQRRKNKK